MNCQGDSELLFSQFDAWNRESEPEAPVSDRESRYGLRTYGIGAQIMRDLNVGKARLLARPRKMPSMAGFSLTITGDRKAVGAGKGGVVHVNLGGRRIGKKKKKK